MRRILRKIAENNVDDLGDIATLADPSVVQALVQERAGHPGRAAVRSRQRGSAVRAGRPAQRRRPGPDGSQHARCAGFQRAGAHALAAPAPAGGGGVRARGSHGDAPRARPRRARLHSKVGRLGHHRPCTGHHSRWRDLGTAGSAQRAAHRQRGTRGGPAPARADPAAVPRAADARRRPLEQADRVRPQRLRSNDQGARHRDPAQAGRDQPHPGRADGRQAGDRRRRHRAAAGRGLTVVPAAGRQFPETRETHETAPVGAKLAWHAFDVAPAGQRPALPGTAVLAV
ncbi:hypothetical protein G6F59_013449 [Rhizopus arrhizus]|nr:hypothetical protein G6F59_013449 [Rhizopus arrhizus]